MDSFSLKWRRGRASRHLFKYLILPTTRKTVSPMKMSNFKMSKLTNHEVYKKLVLTIFTEPIMHPVYSPKFCITIVFSFPWDDCNTQGKLETMVMQNLGGRQGALVAVKIVTEVFKTMLTGSRLHFLLSPQPRVVSCVVKVIWASPFPKP